MRPANVVSVGYGANSDIESVHSNTVQGFMRVGNSGLITEEVTKEGSIHDVTLLLGGYKSPEPIIIDKITMLTVKTTTSFNQFTKQKFPIFKKVSFFSKSLRNPLMAGTIQT